MPSNKNKRPPRCTFTHDMLEADGRHVGLNGDGGGERERDHLGREHAHVCLVCGLASDMILILL